MISWKEFEKIDMRVGTIMNVTDFPEARKPAFKLVIDFGKEIGERRSSAQITDLYSRDSLLGMQVIAVVNFPPKQIGPFMSECLVMGCYNENGEVILLQPERTSPLGSQIG